MTHHNLIIQFIPCFFLLCSCRQLPCDDGSLMLRGLDICVNRCKVERYEWYVLKGNTVAILPLFRLPSGPRSSDESMEAELELSPVVSPSEDITQLLQQEWMRNKWDSNVKDNRQCPRPRGHLLLQDLWLQIKYPLAPARMRIDATQHAVWRRAARTGRTYVRMHACGRQFNQTERRVHAPIAWHCFAWLPLYLGPLSHLRTRFRGWISRIK